MKSKRPPIVIPEDLIQDRATRRLLQSWKNAHDRYHECRRRLNWHTTRRASEREKIRRREKWRKIATILEIEQTLIRWLGEATHHPDLWSSRRLKSATDQSKGDSRLKFLLRQYYRYRTEESHLRGTKRRLALLRREAIVGEIRSIQRMWIELLYMKVFPEGRIPNPVKLHATELIPRKIAKAKTYLAQEVA